MREREKGRRGEFAKNRGSFGYRQKSLVKMLVEENEQEEDEDGDVEEAREKGEVREEEPCRGRWKDG